MKNVPKESLKTAVLMTVLVIAAVILVATVDVQPLGVQGTNIGFATINTGFFNRYGQKEVFYKISTAAGLLCFATAGGFGCFFLYQLIQRKSLSKVDRNLTVMMGMYVMVMIIYVFFDKILIINYRPVLRDKGLESSFPSTHTMIAWAVMVSAIDQWNIYINNQKLLTAAVILSFTVLLAVIICRTLSGVHWLTDISGGILFGDMLVAWYRYLLGRAHPETEKKKSRKNRK